MDCEEGSGVKPYLFPMPVLMIATYDADGVVDVMNMAWGGIRAPGYGRPEYRGENHKTAKNIEERGAFTLSIVDTPHIEAGTSSASPPATRWPTSSSAVGLRL